MNKSIVIGRRIQLNGLDEEGKPLVNIDINYGPYATLDEALEKLKDRVRNTALTFCVIENNEPKEYWFYPDGSVKQKNTGEGGSSDIDEFFENSEDSWILKSKSGNDFIKTEDDVTEIYRPDGGKAASIENGVITIYGSGTGIPAIILHESNYTIKSPNNKNTIILEKTSTIYGDYDGQQVLKVDKINDNKTVRLYNGSYTFVESKGHSDSTRVLYEGNTFLEGNNTSINLGSPGVKDTNVFAQKRTRIGISTKDIPSEEFPYIDVTNEIIVLSVGGVKLELNKDKLAILNEILK